MWLVELALRRPYTFVVLALLLVITSVVTIRRMGTDILPEIDITSVVVVFSYNGMSPDDMEKRVVSGFERFMTTTVNDIERIESQSLFGMGVIRVFFQPGAKIEAALAQISVIAQSSIRSMPPGMTPPIIMRYSASNVPVLQAALGSDTLSEQQIFDLGNVVIRTGLVTVQGAQIPNPTGGKQRLVMIDLDPVRLRSYGLSANDVVEAIGIQNLNLPGGTAKLGEREYPIRLNSSPASLAEFGELPIRTVDGGLIQLRDVAEVRDGFSPQTSLANVDGRRGVIQTIRKVGNASTLDIVERVRAGFDRILATAPPELKVDLLGDQSVFVRAAVHGVVVEGLIAGGLIGLLILFALGSWRSTVIVLVSIPLSVLTSIIVLDACGQTLNLMTLGGLALVVGILVDDATVEIENFHRNLGLARAAGEPTNVLAPIILRGAAQIALPSLVSTLCICIVFIPVLFIAEPVRSLFVPMSLAVVAAIVTSYLLSRTLVPTLVQYRLQAEAQHHRQRGPIAAIHGFGEAGFLRLQGGFSAALDWLLHRRWLPTVGYLLFIASAILLAGSLGRDLFPAVDSGQFRLHVRLPPGTRIETTELRAEQVARFIRTQIPASEIERIITIIGMPSSPINLAQGDPTMVSAADSEVQVNLTPGHHAPTADYISRLRPLLAEAFPDVLFFLKPADIPSQVLSFGVPAPLAIQVTGPTGNQAANLVLARRIREELSKVPGAVDVRLQQVLGVPEFRVDVDRVTAADQGLSQRDVANSVLTSLASSSQTSPGFWLDPVRGIQYSVAAQQPQYRVASLDAVRDLPVSRGENQARLADLASIRRGTTSANITHMNAASTYDVLAGADGTDLGSVASAAREIVARVTTDLPRGTTVTIRGLADSMDKSFTGLAWGVLFAILLIYLVLVINFQSWIDPLIILAALPAALGGIVWILHATGTTVSVPALMGAILGLGVATANSILVVSFANDQVRAGASPATAALRAAVTRLRPVLMTASAMIVGMLPMALALSEGGEQNAPLGRTVIGALIAATVSTLLIVPIIYSLLGGRKRHQIHEASP